MPIVPTTDKNKPDLPKPELWGDELLQYVRELSRITSPGNEMIAELFLYSLTGHVLKMQKTMWTEIVPLDTRLHIFWVQNSRSGKTLLTRMFARIAQLAGISTVEEGLVSSAGLLGSAEGSRGDLEIHDTGILHFDEFLASVHAASARGTTAADILDAFRMLMNPHGHVRKKLANVTIDFTSKATLWMLTTPHDILTLPTQLWQSMAHGGFIARTVPVFRTIPKEDRDRTERALILHGRVIHNEELIPIAATASSARFPTPGDTRNKLADSLVQLRYNGWYGELLRNSSLERILKISIARAALYKTAIADEIENACKIEQWILDTSARWLNMELGDMESKLVELSAIVNAHPEGITLREIYQHYREWKGKADQLLQLALKGAGSYWKLERKGKTITLKPM